MDTAQQSEITEFSEIFQKLGDLRSHLASVLRGKQDVIDRVLLALLANGSILLEDVPGVGKTTLAKSLAALIDVRYRRIQCTPDLLPSDVLGFSVFNPKDGGFEFQPGPVFCNILLVDEINRASPRTQSALLEAMAERQVTVEGHNYRLDAPFVVLATQNPVGFQGTFPLPEAQLDRFAVRLSMDYPDAENEVNLLYDEWGTSAAEQLPCVLTRSELIDAQKAVAAVKVERVLAEYLISIVRETRLHPEIRLGCSPRAARMFFRAAQSRAFMRQRNYALPDDVQYVAPIVLEHRLALASHNRANAGEIVRSIVSNVKVPL